MSDLLFLDSEVKLPLMRLPVRSVVVPIGADKVLISPGSRLTESQYRTLQGVTDIVAPSLFHTAGMAKAKAHFPEARTWGPAGLGRSGAESERGIELTPEAWLWPTELQIIPLGGMPKVNEVVFFHRETRTLIVSDLAFNLLEAQGLGAWVILSIFGTYRKFGVSRFFLRFVEDRAAFLASLKKVCELDFDRIVVGHGHVVTENGKLKLAEALAERGLLV